MAEKNKEDKKEEDTAEKSDDGQKAGRGRKLILIVAITGILFAGLGVGGLFAYKTFGAKLLNKEPETAQDAHKNAVKDTKETKEGSPAAAATGDSKEAEGGHGTAEKVADKPADGKESKTSNKSTTKNAGMLDSLLNTAKFGSTYPIAKMDLNLGNPLENRYLKLQVVIEYRGSGDQETELKNREPQLRDLIISTVNAKTRLELLSLNGKNRLRKELLNRFNEVLEKPVQSIYFTEFLVE